MDLYAFGIDIPVSTLSSTSASSPINVIPSIPITPIVQNKSIDILWTSWCDAVIAHAGASGTWQAVYSGSGLTAGQKRNVEDAVNAAYQRAAQDDVRKKISLFGIVMHDGLRGYVVPHTSTCEATLVLFATEVEMQNGVPEVEHLTVQENHEILDVKFGSDGDVLVSSRDLRTTEEYIVRFQDIGEFRRNRVMNRISPLTLSPASTVASAPAATLAPFVPKQWCSNATTSTVLSSEGRVYTQTSDPRYPACLGRSYDGFSSFQLVPYLAETTIVEVASGGYLSAALSSDGEVFVWGQPCPGSDGELGLLNGGGERVPADSVGRKDVGTTNGLAEAWTFLDEDQDEFVACARVQIDGQEAYASHIAVGHGHLLVAAELRQPGGETKRAVLAAGDGSKGQLGLGTRKALVGQLKEVPSLRGKRVTCLVAAGWTTLVGTEKE